MTGERTFSPAMTDPGERAIVQLAGCLMAAEGNTELDGKSEIYGWSPAYQAIVELRHRAKTLAVYEKADRPLRLSWAEHTRAHARHTEWHAPCGCAYHPEPEPHVHPCGEHHMVREIEEPTRRFVAALQEAEDPKKLTPAEAVFGVLAWLSTTTDHRRQLAAVIDPDLAAHAAKIFCVTNRLGECRDTWPEGLVHPTEEPG